MDDTRQRLLNVAGQVFAQKGFEATTVREICSGAEANIAAVNYYFGDKERLYIEAVRIAACRQGDPPQFDWTDDTSPEEKLKQFLQHLLPMVLDDDRPDWQIELMMREMAHPSQACVELVRSYIGPMFSQLISIVSEFLPADTSQMQKHLQAFSIVAQCLLYRYHRPVGRLLIGEDEYQKLFDLELLTKQILTFSLGGLRSIVDGQEHQS
ncbi:CerR family C-terminal domain-containing protein [Planctomicrobium sp. SH661]|uniref:CerR family C-terminal domain-containing protein n=1 Tax=Planctomicrobium sp. SH661 TaxID=3448124 RepID=UPI003F5BCD51